ncbi:MAG: metal-sensing transcriptional repressor [Bdellovibrionales bacterium]
MSNHAHHTHPAVVKRLKRIHGHLKSVIAMIEDERECLELAQQLHAIEKAVCQAKRALIQDHIDHCLEDTLSQTKKDTRSDQRSLAKFKEITKYL